MLARQRSAAPRASRRRGRRGRVAREVQPQQAEALPRQRVEVGQPAVLGAQRHRHDLAAGEARAALGHRVAGRRHRDRAVDDLGQPEDRLLGAERRHAPRCPGRARRRSAARPTRPRPRAARAAPRRAGRPRRRLDLDRRHRAADERRGLLARLADAEVQDPDALVRAPARLGQADERVGAQAGQDGGAHAAQRLQHLVGAHERGDLRPARRAGARAGSPGPKFTASTPARANSATGVHACLGSPRPPRRAARRRAGCRPGPGPTGRWRRPRARRARRTPRAAAPRRPRRGARARSGS